MASCAVLKDQMKMIPANEDFGTQWYRCLFTAAPESRVYFKGDENIDPEAVAQSVRFHKQGVRFLTSMTNLVNGWEDGEKFKRLCSYLATSHSKYNIPFAYWEALGPIWMSFVESKIGLTEDQKSAWQQMWKEMVVVVKAKIDEK